MGRVWPRHGHLGRPLNSIVMPHRSDVQREPIDVVFPLRGEWTAYHTPAERVPSHGTNELGQRFAYDFLRIERDVNGWKFWRAPTSRYYLYGIHLEDCYGWGNRSMRPSKAP